VISGRAGRAKWIVGNEKREAVIGDALLVRAGQPHKFICADDDPVRQIDIILNPTFENLWLE
jgi:quercetin dioxygenase-like cupin family protein